jgi:hypothetical protein
MALIEAVETNLPRVINLESGYNKGVLKNNIYKWKLYSLLYRRCETIQRWRQERNFRRTSDTGFVC